MADAETLKVIVSVEDHATNALKAIQSELKNLKTTAAVAGAAVAGAFLYKSVEAFADFDEAMQKSIAIMGDVDDAMRKKLEQRAREVARTMRVSHDEAARSYYYLASAGLSAAEALEAMPTVARLAEAAAIDMAEATDYATDIMTAFGYTVKDLGYISDVLVQTVRSANTDLPMLADAMKYVSAVAHTAGVSLTEASAAIGLLSNAGIKGSMAGTGLRRIISELLNPSDRAREVFEKLGITMEDVDLKTHSLADVIELLEEKGATAADVMQIFGERGGTAMLVLMNTGGEALKQFTQELENAKGATEEVAKTQEQTLNAQIDILKNNLTDIAITVGEQLIPALNRIVEAIRIIVDTFNSLPEPVQKVIAQFVAFGSVAMVIMGVVKAVTALAGVLGVGGALTTAASVAGTAISGLITVIGGIVAAVGAPILAIAALGAAILALVFNVGGARDKLKEIIGTIVEAFKWFGGEVKNIISNAFNAVIDALGGFISPIWEKAKGIGSAIVNGIKNGLANLWETLKSALTEPIEKAVDWIKDKLGIASPSKVFMDIGRNIVRGYAEGLKQTFNEVPQTLPTPAISAPIRESGTKELHVYVDLHGAVIKEEADVDMLVEKIERRLAAYL